MVSATALASTNTAKLAELEEELSNSMHDAVAGKDDLEIATFSEDETRTLAAVCTRISVLCKTRDMTKWMEDAEDGKQSSAWTILSAILERGALGYEQEEKVVIRFGV
jgi:cohesin complex subunit SA-1/2